MEKVKETFEGFDETVNYAQVKRDGYRLKITRNPAGVVRVWTRRPQDWTRLVRALPRAKPLWERLNERCTLHAEVWCPTVPATSVITMVKAADPIVRISVFSVERVDALGDSSTLTDAALWCAKHGLDFVPYYKRGTRDVGCLGTFTSKADLPRATGDVEGYVFKNFNKQGTDDKRNWRKWCAVRTATLVVVGTIAGKGKYRGKVGSLVLADRSGTTLCSAGGFTDLQREALSDLDIGRCVEVAFKGVASKGRLRMPRFRRFRDDISPADADTWQGLSDGA